MPYKKPVPVSAFSAGFLFGNWLSQIMDSWNLVFCQLARFLILEETGSYVKGDFYKTPMSLSTTTITTTVKAVYRRPLIANSFFLVVNLYGDDW